MSFYVQFKNPEVLNHAYYRPKGVNVRNLMYYTINKQKNNEQKIGK